MTQVVCFGHVSALPSSHLAAHQRKFILEEGGMGYSNVKVVKSHRKISSDLFAKGIEKFKAFIYLL